MILTLCSEKVFSQQFLLKESLVKSFLVDETLAPSLDVIMEAKINSDNIYEVTLAYQGNSKSFKLKPLTYSDFSTKLKFNLNELLRSVKDKNGTNDLVTKIAKDWGNHEKEIALLFSQTVTFFNTEEERPQVATVYLRENILVYYPKDNVNDYRRQIGKLENVSVEISFYGGFIEKIQVNGKIGNEEVSFNNKYSIGISSTKNIQQLSTNTLYTNEKFTENKFPATTPEVESSSQQSSDKAKNDPPPQTTTSTEKRSLYINLGDVIRYVKKVDVNANDISPVPQLVLLDKDQKVSKLFREESTRLFEAIVYTDFFGVIDEESPNGIIQTEINKRFNINTRRFDTKMKWWNCWILPLWLSEGYGFFQYFDANFHFSKIEQNNKYLLPSNFEIVDNNNNLISTEQFYSPISLLQYRDFSIGGNLNVWTLENQNSKLNFYMNAGFLLGRSGIKESETQVNGSYLNNLEIPFEFKLHLLPEKRFSFILSDKISYFNVFNSDVNLKSVNEGELTTPNNWLNSINMDVNVDISSTGKLFLRYKLIHEIGNINSNFSQLQFGYSFFFLQNNGARKKNY